MGCKASTVKGSVKSVNGKLVVDMESAPKVVAKIAEIKAKYPDNCMAQAFDEEYYNTLSDDQKVRLLTCCLSGVAGLPESGELNLEDLGLPALSMRVRTGRNLNKYPLPGAMTKDDRVNMEKDMKKVFDVLIADPSYGGKYVSITPGHECFIDKKKYDDYVKRHIMFKDMSADSWYR